MSDATELLKIIKTAAATAVQSEKPAELCFGTVTAVNPLKITVEQKLTLGENQLILTKAVTDHQVDIEVSHYTVNDAFMNGLHTHEIFHTFTGGGSCGTPIRDGRKSRSTTACLLAKRCFCCGFRGDKGLWFWTGSAIIPLWANGFSGI